GSAGRSLRGLQSRLRRLGLLKLGEVDPGWGSSIHYAGTIPRSQARSAALRADAEFQIQALPGVYLADSSAWNELPARGLTLTIMAHARTLAEKVAGGSS
ncbi:MAG TPA: hypothetical protein VM598_11850, partial [Bdellovibrionota bacterium]|nr:hypothetical protein [Bdellovibrionota bacterium]